MIRIDGFPMDLAMSEGHSFPGEATKYPVEEGADNSDHIRDLPDEITLECIVSDSPIGAVASDPTRQTEPGPNGLLDQNAPLPSAAAYEKLRQIKARRQPVPIETSLGTFPSMALIDLDVPKDAAKSNGLFFTAKFQKFTFATNKRTKLRVRSNMAGAGGKAKPKAVTPTGIEIQFDFVLWRHANPPGSKFIGGLTQRVEIAYRKQIGVPDEFLVVTGLSGASSPANEYTVVGEPAPLEGERRRAFLADLARDADEKRAAQLKAFTDNNPFKKTQQNLPPGIDVSRFRRPAPPQVPIGTAGSDFVPLTVVR